MLNVFLLSFIVAAVGYVLRPLVGVSLAIVGGAMIWLRGYVFPGTPYFGSYLGARLPIEGSQIKQSASTLETVTGDDDIDPSSPVTSDIDPSSLVTILSEHGILEAYDERLRLVPAFRERWRREICVVRELSDDVLASQLVEILPWVSKSEIIEHDGELWIVLSDGSGCVEKEAWLTVVMATAELAAIRALRNSAPRMNHETRISAAPPLRSFLERCPLCETPIEETAVGACCGSPQHVHTDSTRVLACPTCDSIVTTRSGTNGS